MKELVLIGGGGHCKACIDVIESEGVFNIAGIVDQKEKKDESVLGYKIFATDEDIASLCQNYKYFLITIGQIRIAKTRRQVFDSLKSHGADLVSVVSPMAHVSSHANLEEGTIVMHGCIVNPSANIGKNCIVNTGSIIEHDVQIADHCHIATGAVINGGVHVGTGSFIGSRSVIREGIQIGSDCLIGAGGRVMHGVTDRGRVRDVL